MKKELFYYGLEVFDNELYKFTEWLSKTNIFLQGKSPNELLLTEKGTLLVKECLDRINYNIFC